MTNQPIIELKNVSKVYSINTLETYALQNINLKIEQGEFVSIAGASGCGKSTLLSILGLLDVATSGQYMLSGHDVSGLGRDERARLRNKEIGFVFQSFNLISDLTVYENIELPLTYRTDLNRNDIADIVNDSLEIVDMASRKNHFPSQLSGGQQQRVAVARAICGGPSMILADEPCGNLDSKNAEAVMQLLERLHQGGTTVLIVTHDPKSALRAQRYVELFDGQIVSDDYVSRQDRQQVLTTVLPELHSADI
ncbi:MAG: ABC transporter ATP-binding protein [Gammaproteobacteria bacterium]|nr:ABC transporter ATP-binding protein [Gammaproteobacteria bacterium]MBJ54298.1 ABC transporter ATP-binding protein [Gammaproteobacteria bacterium]|tara:strand:- start:155 stop:910 length:756 start_codon:yes stop_codon:yes gene_type:complete